MNTLSQQDS